MKINTCNWREFKLGDLFEVSLSLGDLKISECAVGDIPLVSSGMTNNGIVGYIDVTGDGKAQLFPKNTITVDMFGNAFYQSKDFYSVSHGRVNILTPKFNMNELIGFFIVTLINKESYKYSYGRAVYSDEISRMLIRLPILADKTPDWKLIEDFIKTLKYKKITTKNNSKSNIQLDITTWKEFKVGDLFELKKCKCGQAGDLVDGTDINYIGAKKNDNGLMKTVLYEKALVSKGNSIIFICDGQGSVGYSIYMDKDFIGSTTLTAGYNPNLNKYNAMFIVTVLDKERYKYSYGRKYGPHLVNATIKLPTKNGQPDWEFMENYIKSLPYGDRI